MKIRLPRVRLTAIEFLIFVTVLAIASLFIGTTIRNSRAAGRDTQRKTDMQALYFALESFHQVNGYYPEVTSRSSLKDLPAEALEDPTGIQLGKGGSEYRYQPTGCEASKCHSYTLSALLEKESPFIKQSLVR